MFCKKGFTLLELLVVVLIIAVLTAIATPRYQIAVNKSKTAEGMMALMAITSAQESYYLATGNYATDLKLLDLTVPDGKYYYYQCTRTCWAKPKYANLPVLEFHLQRATLDSVPKYLGKHWCQTANITDASRPIADSICASLGRPDPSMNGYYYLLY